MEIGFFGSEMGGIGRTCGRQDQRECAEGFNYKSNWIQYCWILMVRSSISTKLVILRIYRISGGQHSNLRVRDSI